MLKKELQFSKLVNHQRWSVFIDVVLVLMKHTVKFFWCVMKLVDTISYAQMNKY